MTSTLRATSRSGARAATSRGGRSTCRHKTLVLFTLVGKRARVPAWPAAGRARDLPPQQLHARGRIYRDDRGGVQARAGGAPPQAVQARRHARGRTARQGCGSRHGGIDSSTNVQRRAVARRAWHSSERERELFVPAEALCPVTSRSIVLAHAYIPFVAVAVFCEPETALRPVSGATPYRRGTRGHPRRATVGTRPRPRRHCAIAVAWHTRDR